MTIKSKGFVLTGLLTLAMIFTLFLGLNLNNVKSVYAEGETLLTEVNLTVTAPVVGETYDTTVISAEPEKYTATLERVYDNTDRKNIDALTEFKVGHDYAYEILVTAETGYSIDSSTKVYVNGKQAGSYSVGDYYVNFELPTGVTVIGGTRCTDNNYNTEYTGEDFYGGYVYLKADPAPEGKVFFRWDIVEENGYSTYSNSANCSYNVDTPSITFTAVYADLIEEIKIEMPKITIGGNPSLTNFTKVDDYAEHYSIELTEWYYYEENTKTPMTLEDEFQKGVTYYCGFTLACEEGYWFPEGKSFTINGLDARTNSRNYLLGEVYGYFVFHTLIPMNVNVTGGTLMVDGVPTNETEFMPGTELTVVVDESQYPEGKVFRDWNISGSSYIIYEDDRAPILTFILKDPQYSGPYNITFTPYYATLSYIDSSYVYAMYPVVGENQS